MVTSTVKKIFNVSDRWIDKQIGQKDMIKVNDRQKVSFSKKGRQNDNIKHIITFGYHLAEQTRDVFK